jgi:hypothetical protein
LGEVVSALEAYADRLCRKPPFEREAIRQRNEAIAASHDAPGWLLIAAGWTLAALDAIEAGGDVDRALAEAVATSDTDVAALEDALEHVAAYQRFSALANPFSFEGVPVLASHVEKIPDTELLTLIEDCRWLSTDPAAQTDIRDLAGSLEAVLESTRAGDADESLLIEACVAAQQVVDAESERRGAA